MTVRSEIPRAAAVGSDTMRATVFHGPDDIRLDEVPRPHAGAGEAVIRITTTTICGTEVHIVKGEYPVRPGLVIGHESVGVIGSLGRASPGTRWPAPPRGGHHPCGQCRACLSGHLSQCGHGSGYEALGGWRFGNTAADSGPESTEQERSPRTSPDSPTRRIPSARSHRQIRSSSSLVQISARRFAMEDRGS